MPTNNEDDTRDPIQTLPAPAAAGTQKGAARAMPTDDYLPKKDADFAIWHGNFATKLTTVYNAALGLTAAQITAIQNDYAVTNYLVSVYLPAFKAATENRTAYKDLMLSGQTAPGVPVTITAQAIPAAAVAVSAPPAAVVVPNIKARLRLLVKQIKGNPNYTAAIGQDLKIIGPAILPPDPGAQPKGSGLAKPGFGVVITWTKGKFTGVLIEGQRGAETGWTALDKDFRSPYVDLRPPLTAGAPEVRKYRLRYLLDDEPVGVPSDIISVTATA